MKVLFVHEIDYRKKVIYEIHEFPELIAELGHEVSFIDFPEQTNTGALFSSKRIEQIGGRVYKSASLRLFSPGWIGRGTMRRLSAMITVVPILLSELSRNKPDVVVNYAVPTYGLQTTIIGRLFRVPVVHRALDASHSIRKTRWSSLVKPWETMVLRTSSKVSANNPEMAEYVRSLTGNGKTIEVHNPPIDFDHFNRKWETRSLRKKLGLAPRNKTILYMGSFFYFSGLGNVLESFSHHSKRDPSLRLILVGGGDQEAHLRKTASRLGIEEAVVFTGFVDYSVLPRYLKLADVAINPMVPLKVSEVALPHKVLQYLASGIPSVSTRLKGLERSLNNENAVRFVDEPSQVVDAAIQLISSREKVATKDFVQHYEKSLATSRLIEFIE